MKKLLTLQLIFLMVLCLCSCGAGRNGTEETSSASTSTAAVTDAVESTDDGENADAVESMESQGDSDNAGSKETKENMTEGSGNPESTINESGLSESELESIYESLEDAGDYIESLADDEVGSFN